MTPSPFPTYPTRPINGGKLELAPEKLGNWVADAKVDGHRIMVHLPTLQCWNRQGQPFSMTDEYRVALEKMQKALPKVIWLDCEGLLRRHKFGQGSLVALDVMDEKLPILERRKLLKKLPLLPIDQNDVKGDEIYLVPQVPWSEVQPFYEFLRKNKPLYEGVIAKSLDFPQYNFQTASPTNDFVWWIKHRFIG